MTNKPFELRTTAHFKRSAKKFLRKHPNLRPRFERILEDLRSDPYRPQLGLHRLGGSLTGMHAVRVTYSYRITLTLLLEEHAITLIDVGSHEDVYR